MRILLVHNRLTWHPITWLSLLIRIFTCSKWNHVAILLNRNGEDFVLESVGKGVIKTPYKVWAQHAGRIVLPMEPVATVEPELLDYALSLVGRSYGFLDLLQIAFFLIRTRWFGTGHHWNGRDGTLGFEGFFCSELGALALGLDKAYLIYPGQFEHMPQLVKGEEFTTLKSH